MRDHFPMRSEGVSVMSDKNFFTFLNLLQTVCVSIVAITKQKNVKRLLLK